jgi:hypothetical protein
MAAERPAPRPGKWIDRYVDRLHILLIAGGVSVISASLALAIHMQTPEAVAGGPISDSATLIVYEGDNCDACEDFRNKVGRTYRSAEVQSKAPLLYRPLEASHKVGNYRLKGPVHEGPVAVLFDRYGREVVRFDANPHEPQAFVSNVERYIKRAMR